MVSQDKSLRAVFSVHTSTGGALSSILYLELLLSQYVFEWWVIWRMSNIKWGQPYGKTYSLAMQPLGVNCSDYEHLVIQNGHGKLTNVHKCSTRGKGRMRVEADIKKQRLSLSLKKVNKANHSKDCVLFLWSTYTKCIISKWHASVASVMLLCKNAIIFTFWNV